MILTTVIPIVAVTCTVNCLYRCVAALLTCTTQTLLFVCKDYRYIHVHLRFTDLIYIRGALFHRYCYFTNKLLDLLAYSYPFIKNIHYN